MSLTRDGGKPNVKPAPYSTPQGPSGQMREGPGLGGTNFGNTQSHSPSGEGGRPGIGGTKHPAGSQDCD